MIQSLRFFTEKALQDLGCPKGATTGNVEHPEAKGFMPGEKPVRVCIEMEEYDSKQIPNVSGQLESL